MRIWDFYHTTLFGITGCREMFPLNFFFYDLVCMDFFFLVSNCNCYLRKQLALELVIHRRVLFSLSLSLSLCISFNLMPLYVIYFYKGNTMKEGGRQQNKWNLIWFLCKSNRNWFVTVLIVVFVPYFVKAMCWVWGYFVFQCLYFCKHKKATIQLLLLISPWTLNTYVV